MSRPRVLAVSGVLFFALSLCTPGLGDPPPSGAANDPLMSLLTDAGLDPTDLGYRPKGYWLRYPDPSQIPYKNRLFDDLMSEPGEIYPTVRWLAEAANRFLTPSYSDTSADALFKLAFYTGWDLKLSGFRPYNAALNLTPAEEDPLVDAVGRLHREAGRGFELFSLEDPADWPRPREEVANAVAGLEPGLRRALAQAVLDLLDAYRWHRQAFRRVDRGLVVDAWNLRDLPATQTDGGEYFSAIDDIARDLDEASLITSSRKAVFAAWRLGVTLKRLNAPEMAPRDLHLEIDTPAGRIVVGGSGSNAYEGGDILLLVDLGGDDVYRGSFAASASPGLPVSVAVDLGGNDVYDASDPMALSQGSGFFGTGVLVDASGDDEYTAGRCSQGYGFFGTGLLADMDGDDAYELRTCGQGGGVLGIGLLFDRAGNDSYRLDGDGQGYGGPGGVGTLVDLAGKDTYYAEPQASVVSRPDYHSEGVINSSNAQGSGMGRRGDLTDGHSWAGGMGTLLDLGGDDTYTSGNWSAGCGYWYGMGFLYDAGGDDLYSASVFSLAAGAHFCIGGLFDEAGNDRYIGDHDPHTGMAFGHDYTIALLFDRQGDDQYAFGRNGLSDAINMSQVFFVDGAGRDRYQLAGHGFGRTDFAIGKLAPALEANYTLHGTETAVFLDLGGEDEYLWSDPGGSTAFPDSIGNGRRWVRPANPAGEAEGRYAGVFRDVEGGLPGWFR